MRCAMQPTCKRMACGCVRRSSLQFSRATCKSQMQADWHRHPLPSQALQMQVNWLLSRCTALHLPCEYGRKANVKACNRLQEPGWLYAASVDSAPARCAWSCFGCGLAVMIKFLTTSASICSIIWFLYCHSSAQAAQHVVISGV